MMVDLTPVTKKASIETTSKVSRKMGKLSNTFKKTKLTAKAKAKAKAKKELVTMLHNLSGKKAEKSNTHFISMLSKVAKELQSKQSNGVKVELGDAGLLDWLGAQRRIYDAGTLMASRLQDLNALSTYGDFQWLHATFPAESFQATAAQKARMSSANLAKDAWIQHQIAEARGGRLPGWACNKLMEMGVKIAVPEADIDMSNFSF